MNPSAPSNPDEPDLTDTNAWAGRVRTIEPSRERGTIQARDGRVLPFHTGLVHVSGMVTRSGDLKPGMPVTFDLSHGPEGPMVVRLWVGEGEWQTPRVPDAF
jgi:cold shock CspA family protein